MNKSWTFPKSDYQIVDMEFLNASESLVYD